MENMKPFILVESRFSESLETMVAENMAKGYAVSGGISTSYNGENVWYVQAMVFSVKPQEYDPAETGDDWLEGAKTKTISFRKND